MELNIGFCNRPCGVLGIENERFSFRYLEAYVSAGGPAISVTMPVTAGVYPDEVVFPFFENLLPEGHIRTLLAERLKTASDNFSRLLEATGGEMAGALSIVQEHPAFESGQGKTSAVAKALSPKRLGEVLRQLESSPFLAKPNGKLRLSLAGAQNKLPVIMAGKRISLPDKQLSTHILKPPSPRFPELVTNEYLCMRAARRAGIDAPPVYLVPFLDADGREQSCFVIERYDRAQSAMGTTRIHQEDLCQIVGIPSARKYVQDGGPGYGELFASTRAYTRPAAVQQNELIRRVLFNLLIGNHDAHGKNFSFIHLETRIVLAPAYDLLCTAVYKDLDQEFAMPFGAATTMRQLTQEALDAFHATTGINLRRQAKQLLHFLDGAMTALTLEAAALKEDAHPSTPRLMDGMFSIFRKNHRVLAALLGKS